MSILGRHLRLSINPALINKNEAKDESLFKLGWQNQSLTPIELAARINEGIAYCGELSGTRRAANFVASGVLSVDIDGTRSIPDVLADPLVQRSLTILYTTVRHTEREHRFRLVFALPRPIESARDMVAASRSLSLRLSGDLAATDAARIFYGSRGSEPTVFDRGIDDALLDELIAQGLDADQRDTVVPGATGAVTRSRLAIANDLVVRRPSGEPVAFSALGIREPICCPFHADTNASAFTVPNKSNNAIGLYCSTCGQSFWPSGSHDQRHDFFDFDKQVEQAHRYLEANRDMGSIHEFLFDEANPRRKGLTCSNVVMTQTGFLALPPEFPAGISFIKSRKGSGKTEEVKRTLQADDGSVLLIGHRITLIRQSCHRLGLECYLDVKGRIQSERIGICLDSLRRLRSKGSEPKRFRTVIIDESEQVLQHLFSDTIDAAARDAIFVDLRSLLQRAEKIVALDADLGWLTFETLSKLSQPPAGGVMRKSHVFLNERPDGSALHMYRSYHQLVGELMTSLADGKRVFVTSNSLELINRLGAAIAHELGEAVPMIAITSETKDRKEVKAFVMNPSELALRYRAILCSPSFGTGVDITFPEQARHIDVVFGFFESNVNTHFDLDQQLARVRHPGAIRVWINPRRFRFETAVDVVKHDIQVNGLYKNVLQGYDPDGKPVYHTDDPLIDMAALAISQQRASKNNLRGNFIDLKRHQGFDVQFVTEDAALASGGKETDGVGRDLASAARVAHLLQARTLTRPEYEDIEARAKDNDEVSEPERWRFARTRIELFYRQPLDEGLVEADDRGRLRTRVIRFETLENHARTREARRRVGGKDLPERYGLRARFLRDARVESGLLYDLLATTPVFSHGRLDTGTTFSLRDLFSFARECQNLKPVIENALGLQVGVDGTRAVKQLNAFLGLIGQRALSDGKSKISGDTVYRYRLDAVGLDFMRDIVERRQRQQGWPWIYEHYNWPEDTEDD